jgi:hypothetical protein
MPDLWKYYRAQSDTDAETFFAACVTAGTTLSAGQKTAIYNLVGSLKWASLWSKMTAIYPFIGGTAGTHAINLKTPGTYNITWSGGLTHNSNGVTGDGSSYGNTGLTPSTALTANNIHVSGYFRTITAEAAYDITSIVSSTQTIEFYANYTSFGFRARIMASAPDPVGKSPTAGMFISSRTTSTLIKNYNKNSVASSTSTTGAATLPNVAINLLRHSSGNQYSTKNIALVSIGSGLTDTDAANLSAFVQSYQTTLGRAV